MDEAEWQAAFVASGVKMCEAECELVNDEQGRPVVTGVSLGTSAGTFQYYKSIAVGDDIAYGVGAVMLSLIETSGLPLAK